MSNRKPEQILWDRVRRNLSGEGFLLKRIENIVDDGMPDVICQSKPRIRTFHGSATMLELKVAAAIPARPTTQLLSDANGLRQAQKNWLLEWTKFGGRSMVIIGVATNNNVHLAIPGKHADVINGATLDELINLDGAILGQGNTFWLDLKGAL